jgi:hypothetical protein
VNAFNRVLCLAFLLLGTTTIAFGLALGFSLPLVLCGALFLIASSVNYRLAVLEDRDR